MKTISQDTWNNTPDDYKTIKEDGTHMKMFYDKEIGTVLAPVNVVASVFELLTDHKNFIAVHQYGLKFVRTADGTVVNATAYITIGREDENEWILEDKQHVIYGPFKTSFTPDKTIKELIVPFGQQNLF